MEARIPFTVTIRAKAPGPCAGGQVQKPPFSMECCRSPEVRGRNSRGTEEGTEAPQTSVMSQNRPQDSGLGPLPGPSHMAGLGAQRPGLPPLPPRHRRPRLYLPLSPHSTSSLGRRLPGASGATQTQPWPASPALSRASTSPRHRQGCTWLSQSPVLTRETHHPSHVSTRLRRETAQAWVPWPLHGSPGPSHHRPPSSPSPTHMLSLRGRGSGSPRPLAASVVPQGRLSLGGGLTQAEPAPPVGEFHQLKGLVPAIQAKAWGTEHTAL